MSDLATSEERQPPLLPVPSSSRSVSEFGVIVFLASDVMLFAAFFSAYFLLRADAEVWPPEDVELDVPRAVAGTLALVISSFTLAAADRAGERPGGGHRMRRWLLVTMALGTAFLVNQLLEYRSLEFSLDSHPYGSAFFLLTGLHGVHVLVGVVAMGLLFVRAVRGGRRHAVDSWAGGVSLFWHLVDVIWVFLFATVWLLQ